MTGLSALVLAAGLSRRMGQPKMSLPWKDTTIIGAVLNALQEAQVPDIVVVVGGNRQLVEAAVKPFPVRTAYNPDFADGEMLGSYRAGLIAMPETTLAILITLGDQPQIQPGTIRLVSEAWRLNPDKIIMPSYQMRRGHPWVLPRRLWAEVQEIQPPYTLRDFMRRHEANIHYVTVDTPTIIEDIDTPDDYQKASKV